MFMYVLYMQTQLRRLVMNTGLLLIRLVVGLTLAAHGAQKLFGWWGGYGLEGTGKFFEGLGFYPGRRHALSAGVVEFGGGLLAAAGLLTPLAAALTFSVMIVAAVTVHGGKGFFGTGGGYEYNVVLGGAGLALAFTGPGAWSLDALFGSAPTGQTTGVIALLVGVAGAAAQLASRRTETVNVPARAH